MVVLTKPSIDVPAASKTAARLRRACSVWASIPSGATPDAGSIPAVPEQNTKPWATIAWLYGPSAAGAWLACTACRLMAVLSTPWGSIRPLRGRRTDAWTSRTRDPLIVLPLTQSIHTNRGKDPSYPRARDGRRSPFGVEAPGTGAVAIAKEAAAVTRGSGGPARPSTTRRGFQADLRAVAEFRAPIARARRAFRVVHRRS